MSESTQQKVGRVRPPKVHIVYEVEKDGAIEMKELPFVVGVLSDLSGNPEEPLPKLKKRKFVEIDRDNFNEILAGMRPRLAYRVSNTLEGDDSQLAVELRFQSLDDFHPENVARQVPALRKLIERRELYSDLLAKMDGNDKLPELLSQVMQEKDRLSALKKQLGDGETLEDGDSK